MTDTKTQIEALEREIRIAYSGFTGGYNTYFEYQAIRAELLEEINRLKNNTA